VLMPALPWSQTYNDSLGTYTAKLLELGIPEVSPTAHLIRVECN
jgi:hypothetical protein